MSLNRVNVSACLFFLLSGVACGASSKTGASTPKASASVASEPAVTASATANPDALPPELTALLTELDKGPPDAARLKDITTQVAQSGNPILMREATKRILALGTRVGTSDWREQHRSEAKAASERHGVVLSDPQLELKLVDWQNDRLIPIVDAMGNLGGDAIVQWAFKEAEDKTLSLERRGASIKLLKRLVPSSDAAGVARLAPLSAEADKLNASEDTAHDSANDVQQVIAKLLSDLKKCNDKALKKNPKLDVNGSLELKVGADGAVTDSHTKDVAPPDLATCIEKVGQGAHFAAPKSERPFTVRVPLVFKAVPAS